MGRHSHAVSLSWITGWPEGHALRFPGQQFVGGQPLGRAVVSGEGSWVGVCQWAQCPCLCQAFTIMDQNRDGFIDKEDLRDTFAALGE